MQRGRHEAMKGMFYLSHASSFNGDVSQWNVYKGSVENMSNIFRNISVFDRNVSQWNIGSVANMDRMISIEGLVVQCGCERLETG